MTAGRPKLADPGTLYVFAHQFYWDFRRLLEGTYRRKLDQEMYERLALEAEAEDFQLSDEQRKSARDGAEEELKAGRIEAAQKDARIREIESNLASATRELARGEAAKRATKLLKIPGEPDTVKALLQAKSAGRVRRICADAVVIRTIEVAPGHTRQVEIPNWPIAQGSYLPKYLSEHATQFIAAKNDARFPKSGRPTSQLKQLWFLSRALAGALHDIEVRTAINLVGSTRPEQSFKQSRAAKGVRRKRR